MNDEKLVFISGSSSITSLPEEVKVRLDNIINNPELSVIVGDCKGIDTLIQEYFKSRKQSLIVYATIRARNNLGFQTKLVTETNGSTGRKFYELKDIAMTNDCSYGFVIWDGYSIGSRNNTDRLRKQGKPVLIFNNRTKSFE